MEKYLSQFENVYKISKGMSSDEKYQVERDGAHFLLRVSELDCYEEKKREYEHLAHLGQAGLPVPECISFEKTEDKVFTLLSWVEGEEAEEVLPLFSPEEQYRYGVEAGRILRQIHENSLTMVTEKNWYERYFEVIDPRLAAYHKEGIPFEGCEKILRFLEENKHLLKTRPLCHHHGDYHMGNLIVNEGKLWVIDWHTMDFDSIGDPWYEFNRIGIEFPMFAKGEIDGYFDGNVPEEFWRLFALYLATSAITSIVWAKHWAPDRLEEIMELNKTVLRTFDNMKNVIPLWYREW